MTSHKPLGRKIRLNKATNSNRRVPAWIMIKTNRRFTRHPKTRNWRRNKLKRSRLIWLKNLKESILFH